MEKDEEYESLFKPHFRRSEVNVVRAVEERKYGYFINNIKDKEGIELYAEEKLVTKQKYKEMRCEMPGMSRSTFLMVFSADGTKVASTHGNHNIYVTDIRSGRNIRTLIGHPRTPWCIAFHPTSNQIVASGCLGGQVRIWDLSGGSEVWTARSTTVIASIAFHPSDRVLVIATYNEIYFWDWSKPEPFVHTSTSNPKEKVRYVAFDKLGHKLITGIANSPQSRWERVRAPVPVPRQAERSASPYRRRITPRLVNNTTEIAPTPSNPQPRETQSIVPERERRITACYRNLVREYEQLVQRYLKLYRPPIMIDRGTDPMEANSTSTSSGTQTPDANRHETVPSPSTLEDETQQHQTPQPIQHQALIAPSRIISVLMNQRNHLRSLQSQESRKHKADDTTTTANETQEKRVKRVQLQPDDQQPSTSAAACTCQVKQSNNEQQQEAATQTQSPRKVLIINATSVQASTSKVVDVQPSTSRDTPDSQLDSTSNESNDRNVDDLLSNIRRTAEEEVRNRILPIIRSVPATDRPELIRLFENSRENVRMRFKEMCPQLLKKCIRGRLMISSSDSSSSEDESANSNERTTSATETTDKTATRNYNTELERLVKTLLTEIERNDAETSSTQTTTMTTTTTTNSTTSTETATATVTSTNDESTTNSSCPSSPLWRRRLFTHRVSAFMPTRVNYNRSPTRLRRWCPNWSQSARPTPRPTTTNTTEPINFDVDVDFNLLNRETVLRYSPPPQPPQPMNFHPFDPPPDIPTINPENIGIGNMYSNIVQDLESSLNDVRNINASNRPGETSDMLSSFSERLENILHQSDTILRNLRSSMDMLESRNSTPSTSSDSPQSPSTNAVTNEPSVTFYDQYFYVRDQRNAAVAADHTYPRNPNTTPNDNMSPLMTSLHLTISHIQRQARLLRQQVESIERIDRALIEVAQLQLIRQMLVELVRYILHGEGRSTTGVSNVRQMMAGTRISDTSPPSEPANLEQPSTSAAAAASSSSTSDAVAPTTPNRPRTSSRKTYPPSRFFKLKRQPRFTSLAHFVSRRYLNRSERNREHHHHQHRVVNASANIRDASTTTVTHTSLNLMSRRLERLLTDHMRPFTRPQDVPSTSTNRTTAYPSSYYSSATDLGEHVLALRLHGCVIRMNRILGTNNETNTIRNYLRTDTTAAVTHDGVSRIGCRHTLTLVIDSMSKQMEELGNMNLAPIFRLQIHSVLAMSLLLCELLLLQVVDSIPPPTGMNLDPERETLTNRINEMCGQMLQNRFSGQSHQLTRSLRLMRQTMRHAYTALGQTYTARRNAMMAQPDTDRRQLIGSINRCLRSINSRRGPESESREATAVDPVPSTSAAAAPATTATTATSTTASTYVDDTNMHDLLTTITDLIARHSSGNGQGQEQSSGRSEHPQPSTSSQQDGNHATTDEDDNEDDDDDDWNGTPSTSNNYIRLNRNLYRSNNNGTNSTTNPTSTPQQQSVRNITLSPVQIQINDAPFSLMSRQQRIEHHQNFLAQRQRFAERVSELRSLPNTFYRPRFLHPFYSSSVNPFDADFDDPQQREQMYENDIITTVTPNHRIQAWDISNWTVPAISNSMKNIVVSECKIHNDASVDVASDGSILVTLLPSGGYLNVTNRLGIYSLRWETLGQCLYTTSFDQNAVSVSLSPLSRHLVVGLASRRFSIAPNDRWIMARVFKIEQKDEPGDRLPLVKELEQTRDSRINCIRWLPTSGQGLIYATNTGQLVVLT